MLSVDDYGRLVAVGLMGGPIIPPMPASAVPRNPGWPKFLHGFLEKHPECDGCGRKSVTGHHVVPFHENHALELVEDNIAAVCLPCHFVICHCGDWRLIVRTVREDLKNNKARVELAQRGL